jgi:hypothetical protein
VTRESPYRFYPYQVPMPLRDTLKWWWHGILRGEWIWVTTETRYRTVKPGDPDYDDAPLGETIVFHPNVFKIFVPNDCGSNLFQIYRAPK